MDSEQVYSKQKGKRHTAGPSDTPKSTKKRARPNVTEHPYGVSAPKPEGAGPSFNPINVPTPTPDQPPTVIEHRRTLTTTDAAKATASPATKLVAAHVVTTDPSHEAATGEIMGHVIIKMKIPVLKADLGELEALPLKGIEWSDPSLHLSLHSFFRSPQLNY